MIEEPENVSELIKNIQSELNKLEGFELKYIKTRNLIQIMKNHAHGDIWLFKKQKINNQWHLTNFDYTMSEQSKQMPYDVIFPPSYINYLGMQFPVPKEYNLVAEKEYGICVSYVLCVWQQRFFFCFFIQTFQMVQPKAV